MKRHSIVLLGSLLAVVLVFAACSNPTAAAGKNEYGTLKVNVPYLAAWAQKLSSPIAASSRGLHKATEKALLAVDSAVFTVSQGSTVIETWTVTPAFVLSGPPASFVGSPPTNKASLPAGSYTLGVDIFNNVNSTTDPVVTGSSSFTITGGQTTDVAVSCLPFDSTSTNANKLTDITAGTTLANQVFGTPWVYTGTTVTTHGAEKWYSFTAPGTYSSVTLTPASGSNAVPAFGVFDSTGTLVTGASGTAPGVAVSVGFDTPGYTYYIAAMDAGGTTNTTNRKVDILVVSATPPTPSKANRLLSYSLVDPNDNTKVYPAYIDQYNETLTVAGIPAGTNLSTLKANFTLSSGAILTTYDTTTGVQANGAVNTLTTDYTYYDSSYHTSLYVYNAAGDYYRTYWIYIAMADQDYITGFAVADGTAKQGVITEDSYGTSTIVVSGLSAGFDLTTAAPTITCSPGATVSPDTGVATDFSAGPVTYTVTNGSNSRSYKVILLKSTADDLITALSATVNGVTYTGTINQASGDIFLGPVPFNEADLVSVPTIFTLSTGATVTFGSATTAAVSGEGQDFHSGWLYAYVTPTGQTSYTRTYTVYLDGDK